MEHFNHEGLIAIKNKIKSAYTAFDAKDFATVQKDYDEIRDMYSKLDSNSKSKAYSMIVDLRNKIAE